ncbi:hypothetical protein EWM64_g8926 [Hericium alpestre]|uniref:Protein kinase domain-containing protein n=1 Tax=Hericium alpestre TaxID=135208 RepID=A0A4Y9ZNI5_9AGAM|nr:hypothetical protein EWM64_g8926 [Hericium alpestre]
MWCDPDRNGIRELCCCPSFVLGITGFSFMVLGCVLTSGVIAQRLTNLFFLDNDRAGDAAVLHAAHIFHSLRLALDHLDRYYRDLTPPSEPNEDRFSPSINTYISGGGRLVKFRYMEPLRKGMTCMTFRAVVVSTDKGHAAAAGQGKAGEEELPGVEEGQEIVVKFAERYGDDAHRLLARQRLAPELYYCGPISPDRSLHYGTRCMVVMEHIEGRMVAELVEQGELSKTLRARISEAVELLHENQMVHGDIRGQKMMIRVEGEEEKVKVLKFDWAGQEKEVRYPPYLSKDIKWVDGVEAFALILREHDREMLKRL